MTNSAKPRLLTAQPDARPVRPEGSLEQLKLDDVTIARMERLAVQQVPIQQLLPVGSMYQTVLWDELVGTEGVLRARARLACNVDEQLTELEQEARKQALLQGI